MSAAVSLYQPETPETPETPQAPKLKPKLKLKASGHLECQVCTETVADQFRCKNCNTSFCKDCFCSEYWSKPHCMKCNDELDMISIYEWLKESVFDKTIIKKYLYKNIQQEQTNMLEFTTIYMDWVKYMEVKKSYSRWGSQMIARGFVFNPALEGLVFNGLNTQDAESAVANYKFFKCTACSGGVVGYGICKKCNAVHCSTCQRIKKDDHKCLEEDVASILCIKTETKPCPSCAVPTSKNGGCDHMHCKRCDTHYFWSTGLIADHIHTQLLGYEAAGQQNALVAPRGATEGLIYLTLEESKSRTGEVAFKKILSTIQSFNENNYSMAKIDTKYNLDVHKLRVKFLKNQLSEELMIDKALKLNIQYRGNMEIYKTLATLIDRSLTVGIAGVVGSSGVVGIAKEGEKVPLMEFLEQASIQLTKISECYKCKIPTLLKKGVPISF